MRASQASVDAICRRLRIEDGRNVEIESKRRVQPESVPKIKKFLKKWKGLKHEKSVLFFDQFLDTPDMQLFRRGASLRLRYKRNGARVYLQYKGPGFRHGGLLYRSEFSTESLRHVIMEESHHDIVHFSDTSVREILQYHAEPVMSRAMRRHLGENVMAKITAGPLLCIYQKEKFALAMGSTFLEPSLDRIFAFHIGPRGPHPLSSFCEFENEIKSFDGDLETKLRRIKDLLAFNAVLGRKFNLPNEPYDKYHRCASFFLNR